MFIDQRLRPQTRTGTTVNLALALGYLPSFDDIVAVTSNPCCVLTTTGTYKEVCRSIAPHGSQQGLRLVVDDTSYLEAVIAPAAHETGLPPSIQFHDLDGSVLHRTYLTSAGDELALDCLRASFPSPVLFAPHDATILPFPSGSSAPRFVDRQVIPHLLAYLTALRLPLCLTVSSGACTQSDSGAIEDVFTHDENLVVRTGTTTLSFDPAAIKAWRADAGALEALSPEGRVALSLKAVGETASRPVTCWQEILASLPPGRAAS